MAMIFIFRFYRYGEDPPEPSLLQAEQSQLPQPFTIGAMLQSLHHLCALRWTLSSTSMFLLYWGAQNWTQHSRCGLPSAEQRGRITSRHLLTILCLMQPRILLDCFAVRAHRWLSSPSPDPGPVHNRPNSAFSYSHDLRGFSGSE